MTAEPAAAPCERTATAMIAGYGDGSLSPVEVVAGCVERIERLNGALAAICWWDGERAIADARASEARWRSGTPVGPLDGVPVTIKDFFDVRGWPTRRGAAALADAPPAAGDAPAVARLREAGAIILGKTSATELGHKASGISSLSGIVRNPWNPGWSAGGSSCGAAVAAATGMAPLNLGSDAAGSIRVPASFCGVYGHKPSGGLVPAFPPSAFGPVAVQGPLTRDVADARLMLEIMAQPDQRDWLGQPPGARPLDGRAIPDVAALRLVTAPGINGCVVEGAAHDAFEAAIAALEAAGAAVTRTTIAVEDLLAWFHTVWHTAVAAGAHHLPPAVVARLEPTLVAMIERGRRISAVEHTMAQLFFADLAQRLRRLVGDAHGLLLPTLPFAAFAADAEHPGAAPAEGWLAWDETCFVFNATLMPASSVPVGFLADGRPTAVQIAGPRWSDGTVMNAAELVRRVLPAPTLAPAPVA
ncbi:MAG: amidase [Alphaproteobacteria bacterium]|nr:amidase [Alphaproteobacteria bacterium]